MQVTDQKERERERERGFYKQLEDKQRKGLIRVKA
jgi:hypothetical protein